MANIFGLWNLTREMLGIEEIKEYTFTVSKQDDDVIGKTSITIYLPKTEIDEEKNVAELDIFLSRMFYFLEQGTESKFEKTFETVKRTKKQQKLDRSYVAKYEDESSCFFTVNYVAKENLATIKIKIEMT